MADFDFWSRRETWWRFDKWFFLFIPMVLLVLMVFVTNLIRRVGISLELMCLLQFWIILANLLCLGLFTILYYLYYRRRILPLPGWIFDLLVYVMSVIRYWLNYWFWGSLLFFLILYLCPRVDLFQVRWSIILTASHKVVMWFLSWIW